MRIIFCGSGDFGIPTLRRLAGGECEIVRVITQPPRPAGRGGQLRPSPLGQAAKELKLPVEAVESINAPVVVSALAALKPDLMVVADFGQMIRQAARDACRLGAINLHGSLLPELRGAAPVNWAVIGGYKRTGVTTFGLVDKLDAGRMFVQKATDVSSDETADQLRARLAELGVEAVVETLRMLSAGQREGLEQDESKATLAPRLKKTDGLLDWSAPAETVRNLIHGTWPWPGGQTRYVGADGRALDVTIARATALTGATGPTPPAASFGVLPGEPGAVLADRTIAAGAGRLEIVQLRPAGGRLMAWRDFVNGRRVGPGAKFVTVRP